MKMKKTMALGRTQSRTPKQASKGFTEIVSKDEFEAMKKSVLDAPHARQVYDRATASFMAARLVKDMRKQAGLTQQGLADIAKITQSGIARLEQGDARNGPSVETLNRVADACGMDLVLTFQPKSQGESTSRDEIQLRTPLAGAKWKAMKSRLKNSGIASSIESTES